MKPSTEQSLIANWEAHALSELNEILFLLWGGHFSTAGDFLDRLHNSKQTLEQLYSRDSPSLIQAERDGTQKEAIEYYKNPPDEPN